MTQALINGEPAGSVNILDRGFQYGDGLFETIAVFRGEPLLWQRHIARLSHGAGRLGIAMPPTDTLATEAKQLSGDTSRAVLKLALTRGVGGAGYAVTGTNVATRVLYLTPWPDRPVECARTGISLHLCKMTLARNAQLAGIKHLNRLEQVLARREWGTEHAEGIMCDDRGDVIEGTMSNLFIVRDGELRTPDLANCGVEGIMREVILEAATQRKLPVRIGRITLAELDAASEMFISNSLIGIWPVRQWRDREYQVGPITHKLQEVVREAHCFDRE